MQVVKCDSEIFIERLTDACQNQRHHEIFEIISSEVEDMMKNNKPAIMRAFELSEITVDSNLTDKEIIDFVYASIQLSQKFTMRLLEFMIGEKQEHSNFIGYIVEAVGIIISGIGKAVSAGIRGKSELVVAREKVKTEKEVLNKSRYEFLNETIAGKDKSEQAQAESKRQLVLVSESGQKKVAIAITVSLIMFTGVMLYLTYKSRVENA